MARVCSVGLCRRKHYAHGLCYLHYRRVRDHGEEAKDRLFAGLGTTPEEKFWSRVDTSPGQGPHGECWEWKAGRTVKGYGSVTVAGKSMVASRAAFYYAHGSFPINFALHTCDNPPCCRPDHIYDGTPKNNSDDMYGRGRDVTTGSKNHCAVVVEDEVRTIKKRLRSGDAVKDIAKDFGVAHNVVWQIDKGRTWKQIQI